MSTITTTPGPRAAGDQHGNPISGSAEAVALVDLAVDQLLRYRPEAVAHTTDLCEQHPDVALGHGLAAYLSLVSTEGQDAEAARDAWQAMGGCAMNDRERAHHAAIGAWINGDWRAAAARLDELLLRWPTDLLALLVGHQLDFFLGDAANLRDRPARSLLAIDGRHPHAGFVRGMLSFGLEESGHHGQAADVGHHALASNPDDVWAIHAVTHAHEMRGRAADGIRFLQERRPSWEADNFMAVHNWWHLAIFHLEADAVPEALAIHDERVHHAASEGIALEMVDASGLLWRLHLDGRDTGDRFASLSDAWAARPEVWPWHSFNDLHAVLAHVGAGRLDAAREIVDRLTAYVTRGGIGTNVAMTTEVGLPACRAIVQFGEGRWDDVVDTLTPIRGHLQRFGGSHAQRDVLQRTLLEAAFRARRTDLARALLSERLALRDASYHGWGQQTRLLHLQGAHEQAGIAAEVALQHRVTLPVG
jgi:hypothetical protein